MREVILSNLIDSNFPSRLTTCMKLASLVVGLKIRVRAESLFGGVRDARLLVFPHPLFEEVRLALQRNQLHEIERVRCAVKLGLAQRDEQAVGHELDVPAH